MECELISKEHVKPSSPTPQNLRTYKFSLLDQIFPPMLVPIVLYFPNVIKSCSNPDLFISQTTQLLKQSLSLILTRYYPLAGRLNSDGQSIDCNDEGVPFVVAKFKGQNLSNLLTNPNPNFPSCLLPCEVKWDSDSDHGPDSTVTLIQISSFDCGGVAIGAVFSHILADAMTIATFLESWAAVTRGSNEPVSPNYIAHLFFPQKEGMPRRFGSSSTTRKSVAWRYKFDASAISSLKSKTGNIVERPTRVEVVSALIWKCFMAASLANNAPVSLVAQAVNLRRRAKPPFPPDCFGNFVMAAAAASGNGSKNGEKLGELVAKMRDAINMIDGDLINRMWGGGDEGLSAYYKMVLRQINEVGEGLSADILTITSWCGFGFYGIEFGWGKPVWVTRCGAGNDSESRCNNQVWLMDTRDGDGIEAWVILDEKYMSVFENVEELRALASVDPSPLDV